MCLKELSSEGDDAGIGSLIVTIAVRSCAHQLPSLTTRRPPSCCLIKKRDPQSAPQIGRTHCNKDEDP